MQVHQNFSILFYRKRKKVDKEGYILKDPSLYRTEKGEQGVLLVEPYKLEILPYWKFKTPDLQGSLHVNLFAFQKL